MMRTTLRFSVILPKISDQVIGISFTNPNPPAGYPAASIPATTFLLNFKDGPNTGIACSVPCISQGSPAGRSGTCFPCHQ